MLLALTLLTPPLYATLSIYPALPNVAGEKPPVSYDVSLEDMLAEKGLSVSFDDGTPVILAYAPQDKGGQQSDVFVDQMMLMDFEASGNIMVSELVGKIQNNEPLNDFEYQAMLGMAGLGGLPTFEYQAVMSYLSSSPLDTINARISDMTREQKVNVYKNLAVFEKDKHDMDASKVIDYYRQLIRLEPETLSITGHCTSSSGALPATRQTTSHGRRWPSTRKEQQSWRPMWIRR